MITHRQSTERWPLIVFTETKTIGDDGKVLYTHRIAEPLSLVLGDGYYSIWARLKIKYPNMVKKPVLSGEGVHVYLEGK